RPIVAPTSCSSLRPAANGWSRQGPRTARCCRSIWAETRWAGDPPERVTGPAVCSLGRVAEDALDLQVVVETEFAPLPAVSALAVAPEGAPEVEGAVHRDPARPDAAGQRARHLEVGAADVGRETVLGVVGDLDGVVEIVVGDDRQHRTEDLLAGEGHVVGDVGEHRRLDVVAAVEPLRPAGAARDQGGALVDAAPDEPLDLVELPLRHHRADRHLAGGIADGG